MKAEYVYLMNKGNNTFKMHSLSRTHEAWCGHATHMQPCQKKQKEYSIFQLYYISISKAFIQIIHHPRD